MDKKHIDIKKIEAREKHKKSSKKLLKISGILLVCVIILVILNKFLMQFTNPGLGKGGETATSTSQQTPGLIINNTPLLLEIADTPQKQEQGLSGRISLPLNHAMLFVFDHPDVYAIWMKNMKFNIDIFWLDADYKIITLKENVSPSSYPKKFIPDAPASYVLETNAGVAAEAGLAVGMKLDIIR